MSCRFCGKSDGVLLLQRASDDYVPARRGYRALGIGPSRYHAGCHAEAEAFEVASRARYAADVDATNETLRAALARIKKAS